MEIFNNTTKVVKDDLVKTIKRGDHISIADMLALGALNGNCRRCGSTERHVKTLLGKYKNDDVMIKSSVIRDDLLDICPEAAIGGNHG